MAIAMVVRNVFGFNQNLATSQLTMQLRMCPSLPIIVIIVIRSLPFMRRRCEGAFSKSGIILCAGEEGEGKGCNVMVATKFSLNETTTFSGYLTNSFEKI